MKIRTGITKLLCQIIYEDALSHVCIERFIIENQVDARDARLIRKIIRGVLENYRLLNHFYKKFVSRPPRKEIHQLLLISLYQFIFLDKVPAHAIVNEAVEIAKEVATQNEANFVNAVLRKALDRDFVLSEGDFDTEISYLGTKYSYPDFIVDSWIKRYGVKKTTAMMKSKLQDPRTYVAVNTFATSSEELIENPDFVKDSNNFVYYIGEKEIRLTDEYINGKINVQDAGSQIVGNKLHINPGDKILDMCSAPGGKCFQIYQQLDSSNKITAIDASSYRLKQLQKNALRLQMSNIATIVADSTKLQPILNEKFHKILLDAPCSGVGSARRKPEILLRVKEEKISRLAELQSELLESAYRLLETNGQLLYATCTLTDKENKNQINRFLERHPDMILLEEKDVIGEHYEYDFFYYALMEKNEQK